MKLNFLDFVAIDMHVIKLVQIYLYQLNKYNSFTCIGIHSCTNFLSTCLRRNSGSFCSPESRSTCTRSNSTPFSKRQAMTLCGQTAMAGPYTLTTMMNSLKLTSTH